MWDETPNLLAMIAVVALVVIVVILIFAAIGYAFGRLVL
jgi:preprotein translocase subunit SecE